MKTGSNSAVAAVMAGLIFTSIGVAEESKPSAAEVLRIKWVNPPESPPPGVVHATFQSKAVHAKVGYNIYLPEGYDQESERRVERQSRV